MSDDHDGCEWVSFFWYRPTRVVLDQRPSNSCVCVVWNCTEHKPSEILQFALQLVCHIMLQLLLRVAASVIAHNYIYRFVVTCHCRTPTEDAVASTSLATVSDVRPTEDAEELPRKSF